MVHSPELLSLCEQASVLICASSHDIRPTRLKPRKATRMIFRMAPCCRARQLWRIETCRETCRKALSCTGGGVSILVSKMCGGGCCRCCCERNSFSLHHFVERHSADLAAVHRAPYVALEGLAGVLEVLGGVLVERIRGIGFQEQKLELQCKSGCISGASSSMHT